MKTKTRKEALLDKKLEKYLQQEGEWIQMANFQYINRQQPRIDYMRLQEHENQTTAPYIINPYQNHINSYHSQKVYAEKPYVPQASYNNEPAKIVMNGLTFIHKDALKGMEKQKVKPKTPQMEVVCNKCNQNQMVPGNTHAFICYNCQKTQDCIPQYGIFICGHCEKKVWYLYGTSQLIKCLKCNTINKVLKQLPQNNKTNEKGYHNPYGVLNQEMSLDELKSQASQLQQIGLQEKQLYEYPDF